MVAGDAQGVARLDHGHHAAQHTRAVRAAVDEVADEDGGAAVGVDAVGVAQLAEQRLQLGGAAVDVADDVEGAGEVGQVVEALLGDDGGVLGLRGSAQHVHLAEALALQVAQGAAQFAGVALDDPAGHVGAVAAGGVALGADLLGHVEDDGDGQHVVLPGQLDQLTPGVLLHVGGVDDGAAAGGEPLARDVVQDVEGVTAGALVVLVVGDQAPAEVGGDDLGRREVAPREGGLAGAGGADQHDEGEVGDGQGAGPHGGVCGGAGGACGGARGACGGARGVCGAHAAFASFSVAVAVVAGVSVMVLRVNRASWVGGPTSGSSGPTGRNSTS